MYNITNSLLKSGRSGSSIIYLNSLRYKVNNNISNNGSSLFSHVATTTSISSLTSSTTTMKWYSTISNMVKEKYYSLSQFPYPSGNLHMGHVRVYTMSDCIARLKRMQGYEVVHPMGWDAFGLPAENAAIEKQISPSTWTNSNIDEMRRQFKSLDLQFDWDRELSTCSPDYYRWTQEIFLKLYKEGLAMRKHATVNWDPIDQTVLANEQVDAQGRSWRSNAIVEKREMKQWYFQITKYADRLVDDLQTLTGWPEEVKNMQREWIGRSFGALVNFIHHNNTETTLTAFTTRPETLFGCTFLAIHYKHPILKEIKAKLSPSKLSYLEEFIASVKKQQEENVYASGDPQLLAYNTGELVTTSTGYEVPLIIASTVLPDYGTGCVMGVPGHNQVDHNIAKLLGLPIKHVLSPPEGVKDAHKPDTLYDNQDGLLMDSGVYNTLSIKDAVEKMAKDGLVTPTKSYRIRDWLLSRQRYWGTPIPIIHCDSCGEVPVPSDQLPVVLPTEIQFTGKGSLLNSLTDWKSCKCPNCGANASRETDTMDTFVDSSWYYLRFLDNKNDKQIFDKEKVNRLMPVDVYVGGIEHAILHLLYSRFITKFLNDQNLIDHIEPFKVLLIQGLVKSPTFRDIITEKPIAPKDIIYKDGKPFNKLNGNQVHVTLEKMSKSKLNGIDPSEMISKYGSDTLKLYVLFKAPPENSLEWDTEGIEGCRKWLKRVETLIQSFVQEYNTNPQQFNSQFNIELKSQRYETHSTIDRVTESIDRYTFNTGISALMSLSNSLAKIENKQTMEYYESLRALVILLAPFAPIAAQEYWSILSSKGPSNISMESCGNGLIDRVSLQKWPKSDKQCLESKSKQLVIQINGKFRACIDTNFDSQSDLEKFAIESMGKRLTDQPITKTFFSTTKNGYTLNFILQKK